MASTAPASSAGTEVGTMGDSRTWILGALAVTFLAGLALAFFDSGSDGALFAGSIASMGALAGASLLTVRHLRAGREMAAAGFAGMAVLAIAEVVAGFSGAGADQVFVSLAILHLPAQALIASQDWSPLWTRAAAALSGVVLAIYGYVYTFGDDPADPENAILIAGWILLLIAIIGWFMTVREEA
jgi:FtsH-binding integral membrane protein